MQSAMRLLPMICVLCGAFFHAIPVARADETDRDLAVIHAVGSQGSGAVAARQAQQRLSAASVQILPRLLAAMDTDNIVAANWYRVVFEDLVECELKKSDPQLPVEFLRSYVADSGRHGRSRRLVLEVLDRFDPAFRPRLIATLLDDPEFRDDAVAAALAGGESAQKRGDIDSARKDYQSAYQHARNSEQVRDAANRLRSLGDQVSIVEHLGFVTDWYLLGAFDAPGQTGFDTVFPPETKVDLTAEYEGQSGRKIRWTAYRTPDDLGELNLIQAIASVKEAVGYAYAELDSPRDQPVELRCSADDNLSVWLNGQKVFGRNQWLNGTRLDRFITPTQLKAGKNRVLVKICQGPQHVNPAVGNNWSMQLRFCTKDGAAAHFAVTFPTTAELQRNTVQKPQ